MKKDLTFAKEVGARLMLSIKSQKYTYTELGKAVHVTPQYVSDLAHGRKNGSVQVYVNLAKELNLSTDYLFLGKPSHSSIPEEVLAVVEKTPHNNYEQLIAIVSAINKNSK